MIIKGLPAIERHMASLRSKAYAWYPSGSSVVGDHDEDYLIDALFDIPNT